MKPSKSSLDRYSIESDYASLPDGASASSQMCPACGGGMTGEASLSVSREGGQLLWYCHRAACGWKGGTSSQSVSGGSRGTSKRGALDVPTYPLTEAARKFWCTTFDLPASSVDLAGLRWTGDGNSKYGRRIAFPIYGPERQKRGENYRSYTGARPKAVVNLFSEDAIACCWYRWRRASKCVVVVEDQVSAIKVAPHYDTMALLGTNLSDAKINEIKAMGYDSVYLSLDADATAEAVRIQLATRSKLPNLRIVALTKDIKNQDREEFQEYLTRLI